MDQDLALLQITVTDVDSPDIRALQIDGNDRVLGGDEKARAIFDALPRAVSKRVVAIVPDDFALKEIELSFQLGGTVLGIGVTGNVKIKLAPKG